MEMFCVDFGARALNKFGAKSRKLFRIRRSRGSSVSNHFTHEQCVLQPLTLRRYLVVQAAEYYQRMEDKGKGFSLRQKKSSRRPPISAPKQISSHAPAPPQSRPNGASEPSARVEADRPKLGGNTSDLVKRRYSTRFTQLPDFSSADAPPVPKLPDNHFLQPKPHAAPAATQRIPVDILALRNPDLQAEHCKLAHLLSPFLNQADLG